MKKLILVILSMPVLVFAAPIWKSTTALSGGSLGNATLNSYGTFINGYQDISVQAVYTGTATGTIKVQVSNDNVQMSQIGDPATNVVNWIDYTGSSNSLTAPGNRSWDFPLCGYRWIRTQYLKTNGTGSLSIIVNQKSP